jgi:DNA-binding transcriptional ArsR family regulator
VAHLTITLARDRASIVGMPDDDVAHLLAHPLRQLLLFEYDEPTSPSKAAARLGERVNVVSYHTDVLRRHGWIELVGTERRRGATEHFYRATRPRAIEDAVWARMPARTRRAIVLGALAVTADVAKAAALVGGFDHARAHLSRSRLEVDESALDEVAATLRETVTRVEQIAAAARERAPAVSERHELIIQCFRTPPTVP